MLKNLTLSFLGAAALVAASTSGFADGTAAGSTAAAPAASTAPAPVAPFTKDNPFAKPSKLFMQAPPFDKIKDSDYQPAIEEGIKEQRVEVDAIANNPDKPTFENTIAALEKSGQLLNRVGLVFSAVTGANTDDALQQVQDTEAPKLQAAQDYITLNSKLFARIETLYNERTKLKLDQESSRLLEYYYQEAVLAGAKLNDADKESLKKLNGELAELSNKFQDQLLAGTKASALVVDDKASLAGLSDAQIASAASNADSRKLTGKWVIPLQNTTQQPDLQFLTDRDTRQKLFEASWLRTEHNDANDTRATILRIAEIRAEQAKLMGYPDYATWKLQDQMAKTPAAVDQLLGKLVPAVTAKARDEAKDIQDVIDQEKGGFKLAPYDWNYYAEKVRKAKYDLDDAQVRPYFELNKVLKDGVFYAANQLYGVTFKERHDLPVWQSDVRVFEVFDSNKKPLGLFYCDYFKRDNKSGGAWMSNLVTQSKVLGTKPVIYNVANFAKPEAGKPALLSFDDVTTMFHEFGHGLHGLFADQKYPTLSGANTARDWVEFPSQFNEHWASDPKVFAHYARNYQTGAPMPAELVAKIKKASTFNQGYDLTEVLAASELDMNWHELAPGSVPKDVDQFETDSLTKDGLLMQEVPTRYRSSYFLHIWSNGYAAGYYAYTWTRMLADDSFSWFEKNGGLTRKNGDRFRKLILSRGNTEDYNVMFKAFNGHAPDITPYLKDHGIDASGK
ncbi:MAG TPA: peptidyl-dipeptidase Dcp [Gammaproteobacteria bacterium]|jgi:peptidyl-dipeptidase Dcp